MPALGRSVLGLAAAFWLSAAAPAPAADAPGMPRVLHAPVWVYNNWSAYDELSDEVPLTQDLAMRELGQLLRLKRAGVKVDYYVMDAFWYDADGGYRVWRKDWPDGPDPWLKGCLDNGIKPGLWFGTNSLVHLNAAPKWRDSLTEAGGSMALYRGGFLDDFADVLQHWYDRGVRLFKLDFADFDAAAKGDDLRGPRLRQRNQSALMAMLARFRQRNPDVVLVAFNGFVGDVETAKSAVLHSDVRWLDVFDTLYAGDPRPANVPEMNFWRSVDIYTDRMVRRLDLAGVPLDRIDSTGFMIGDTGTIYGRRTAGWRGMAILTMARGGWIDTLHGNLEFLDDDDLQWFARAQSLFGGLQKDGQVLAFGGFAGDRDPYGYDLSAPDGGIVVLVNPSQAVQEARLPRGETGRPDRVLYRDAGFEPAVQGRAVRLGPGELAVVGTGRYADPRFDLGVGHDIRIPRKITPVAADFRRIGDRLAFDATIAPPPAGDLRIIMRQKTSAGQVMRSVTHQNMGGFFTIRARQAGRDLPVESNYGKVVWSGLAWAAGEVPHAEFDANEPITVTLSSKDKDHALLLEGQVYAVEY